MNSRIHAENNLFPHDYGCAKIVLIEFFLVGCMNQNLFRNNSKSHKYIALYLKRNLKTEFSKTTE